MVSITDNYDVKNLVHIGSGNDMLTNGTKLLPEPMSNQIIPQIKGWLIMRDVLWH